MKDIRSNRLTLDEKAMLIKSTGLEISSCSYANISVTLYRIKDEFVEIWRDITLRIVRIESLKEKTVNPYLKYLNLANLN